MSAEMDGSLDVSFSVTFPASSLRISNWGHARIVAAASSAAGAARSSSGEEAAAEWAASMVETKNPSDSSTMVRCPSTAPMYWMTAAAASTFGLSAYNQVMFAPVSRNGIVYSDPSGEGSGRIVYSKSG